MEKTASNNKKRKAMEANMKTNISAAINYWRLYQKGHEPNKQKAIDKLAELRVKYEKQIDIFEQCLAEMQYQKGVSIK